MEKIILVGAAVVDIVAVGASRIIAGDSNPGSVDLTVGGVAKNIAENLTRLGMDCTFVTFFGTDGFTGLIQDHLDCAGIDYTPAMTIPGPSGKYVAVHRLDGALETAINDFRIMDGLRPEDFEPLAPLFAVCDWLILDANLPAVVLDHLTDRYRQKKIVFDGVSRAKAVRIRPFLDRLWLIKINRGELGAILGHPADDVIYGVKDLLAFGVPRIIVTNGVDPITYNIDKRIYQSAIFATGKPVSSSGCGDALVAGTIYGLAHGKNMHEAINYGKKAASLTMEVAAPCHPALNPAVLEE
ncbi:MAG: PfkB family carbohydrate kinase [bacterium]